MRWIAASLVLAACATVRPVAAPLLRFEMSPADVQAACDDAERTQSAALDAIVRIPPERRTFANTVVALEDAGSTYDEAISRVSLFTEIHPDAAVREAARVCDLQSGLYVARVAARHDVYLAVREVAEKTRGLDAQDQRLLDLTMRDFRLEGQELDDARRAELLALNTRFSKLAAAYYEHLDNVHDRVEVDANALTGMSEDFVKRLERTPAGKLVLTDAAPDVLPILDTCSNAEVRRRMWVLFWTRGGTDNVKTFDEIVAVRDQIRTLLGFATTMDQMTATNMMGDAAHARDFLARLRTALAPHVKAQTDSLRAVRAAETGIPVTAPFDAWDQFYYQSRLRKRDLGLDEDELRQFFPADRVVAGAIEIFQRALGVSIREVPDAKVWASGVKLYEVRDAASGELEGRFYFDVYGRPGKSAAQANFIFTPGTERRPGLGLLMVTVAAPVNGVPTRLDFREVKLILHELGHTVHTMVNRPRYRTLARVPRDFVEVPSEMIEGWVHEPEVLRLISQDPEHPEKPMPEALQKKLADSRRFLRALFWAGQLSYALSDMTIHTGGATQDSDGIIRRGFEEILGYRADPSEHWAANTTHFVGGYAGAYYTYLWNAVLASDLLTRFKARGVLDPEVGMAYRKQVLERGSREEQIVQLRTFLGRDPDERAFIESL